VRASLNPFLEPDPAGSAPDPGIFAFHRLLPGYAPTPLHSCAHLAAELGIGGLFIKDESQRFGLNAFKGLGAVWALHRLTAAGASPKTVAAATEGNHGRAVAWAARQLGFPAVIFIPDHAAPARIENLRREGAQVELVAGSYDEAVARCARVSAERGWQVVSDTGYEGYTEIPQWIAEGYTTLFREIEAQRSAAKLPAPDVVLVQGGVGGLLHSAVLHFRASRDAPILVAVEPEAADALQASIESPAGMPTPARGSLDTIMAGLNCGRVSLTAWPVVRRGIDMFVTVRDGFAEAAMRRLARPNGDDPQIVSGETGAAGLAGLLALLQSPELAPGRRALALGPERRVLVINTEGATDPAGYRRIVGEGVLNEPRKEP
jgi:diaminopropionate ammonia-lyase